MINFFSPFFSPSINIDIKNRTANKSAEPSTPDFFESIIVQFHTINISNDEKLYNVGILIKDNGETLPPKKIVFINNNIKDKFNFKQNPLNKEYLVSCNVHYTEGKKQIAKYEITDYIDEIQGN